MELTQTQLADAVGTTQQNVAGWEKGKSLPKQATFDRLVEVFGEHSVVAALPPRGEILLAHSAIDNAMEPAFRRTQESLGHVVMVTDVPAGVTPLPILQNRRLRNETLRELLPEKLRGNTEVALTLHDLTYRVDYLSENLCVEIKTPTPSNVLGSARSAIQQLYLFNSVLKQNAKAGGAHPKPLLILIKGDINLWDSPNNNPRGKFILTEAGVMGITVAFVDTLEAAASYIKARESDPSSTRVAQYEDEDY
jgi:transcriptional regulator with XRE-family HTH domain